MWLTEMQKENGSDRERLLINGIISLLQNIDAVLTGLTPDLPLYKLVLSYRVKTHLLPFLQNI